jgi:hypothetical protein
MASGDRQVKSRGPAGHGYPVTATYFGGELLFERGNRAAKSAGDFSAQDSLFDGVSFLFSDPWVINGYHKKSR